jgi:hypothetical protein
MTSTGSAGQVAGSSQSMASTCMRVDDEMASPFSSTLPLLLTNSTHQNLEIKHTLPACPTLIPTHTDRTIQGVPSSGYPGAHPITTTSGPAPDLRFWSVAGLRSVRKTSLGWQCTAAARPGSPHPAPNSHTCRRHHHAR